MYNKTIHRLRRTSERLLLRIRLMYRDASRWWKKQDQRYTWKWRAANGILALVILTSAIGPTFVDLINSSRYMLTADALQLVGKTDSSLNSLLSYDTQSAMYQFNKDAIKDDNTNPLAALKSQVGTASGKDEDKSTYALDVPTEFSKGVTYHDINSDLSFTMTPKFAALDGKLKDGRLVFPLSGSSQAVYTLKNNGLKEDIVVNNPSNDTMTFDYGINLPKTLAIKEIPDSGGAIGIYGADPSLFGNITYGSDKDRQAVEKAREKAAKSYLIFGLPAPVTKDAKGNQIGKAHFELHGTTLKVVAEGLSAAKGAVTIDPSVVVTSSSDFGSNGNDESMIDFSTSGQVSRGGLTGGSIGAWNTTSTLTNAVEQGSSATYDGYVYQFGGFLRTAGTRYSTSSYASLNSNGTLGTWNTTTPLPYSYSYMQTVAYNGYMYVLGGLENGTSYTSDVFMAPINSNGTLGSWTAATSLPGKSAGGAATAYNGYIYFFGGASTNPPSCNSSATCLATAYYAPLNAKGNIGTWTSLGSLATQRAYGSAVAYNGYMYLVGGLNNIGLITAASAVQYAVINSDGSLGGWVSTNSFSGPRYAMGTYVYDGYLYITTGYSTKTDTQYAQINANGSVGTWRTTTSMTVGLTYATGVEANGYLYLMNGYDATNDRNEVWYSKIDPVGMPVTYANSSFTGTRRGLQTVAYNGYLYVMGGDAGSTPVATTYYATIASDGTLGAFNPTSSFTTARTFFGAVAYDGYMYVLGGCTSTFASCNTAGNASATVYSSPIASNGTLGATWTSTTGLGTGKYAFGVMAYNGYVYVMGGVSDGGALSKTVQYASLTSGVVGTWTSAAATYQLPNSYAAFGIAMYGQNVYIAGGCAAGTITTCTTRSNAVFHATLNGSGGGFASTWSSGGVDTSFTSARYGLAATVVNGYLYIGGGYDNSTYYADTQFARIKADGSIDAWQAGPSISATSTGSSMASYAGSIYWGGGQNGSGYQNTLRYAVVNNGGSGTVGNWTAANSFTTGRGAQGTAINNGYMYILGGQTSGSPLSDVQYVSLNSDGSVGTWTPTTSLPTAMYSMGVAIYKGNIYILGGNNGAGTKYNTVYYAPINSNGSLGSWTSTNSFTQARSTGAAAAYNGYLYLLGGTASTSGPGCTGSFCNDVQFAPINSDGTVGAWHYTHNSTDDSTTFVAGFTGGRYAFGSMIYNGYVYVAGGQTSSTMVNDVQVAPINSNGTIGAWSYTTAFNGARGYGTLSAQNGFVYLVAGFDGTNSFNDVQFAPIASNGTIGTWQSSTAISGTRYNQRTVNYAGYLFFIGGYGSGAFKTDVQSAPINSINRTARYSKIIDLGVSMRLNSITYSGAVGSVASSGNSPISFRGADTDGVFGNLANASTIAPNATPCQNLVRYVQVTAMLDDSMNATFPDADTTPSNVTDLTVNYSPVHPLPNVRLRGGQTVQDGTKTPLDTCNS